MTVSDVVVSSEPRILCGSWKGTGYQALQSFRRQRCYSGKSYLTFQSKQWTHGSYHQIYVPTDVAEAFYAKVRRSLECISFPANPDATRSPVPPDTDQFHFHSHAMQRFRRCRLALTITCTRSHRITLTLARLHQGKLLNSVALFVQLKCSSDRTAASALWWIRRLRVLPSSEARSSRTELWSLNKT